MNEKTISKLVLAYIGVKVTDAILRIGDFVVKLFLLSTKIVVVMSIAFLFGWIGKRLLFFIAQ